MDFEEYMTTTGMEEQTENSCAWEFYKELYKAGQQSKQVEVDKLKMSNHYLSVQVIDAEAYSEHWKYERDKLQKRIDDLKAFCIKGIESKMLSIEYNQALIDMHKILKGEQS